MRRNLLIWTMAVLLMMGASYCTKPFELEGSEADNSILVVEGNIIAGNGASNTFLLTRMAEVVGGDTLREQGARVEIQSSDGGRWIMAERSPGVYSGITSIPTDRSLKLRIQTSSGNTYETPFQKTIVVPQIDSVTWVEEDLENVRIFVNTGDPSNTVQFYKWTFEETWESRSRYESFLGFSNGFIVPLAPSEMYFQCWKTREQNPIILANTVNLAQNLVSRKQITEFAEPDERLYTRYSILVKQEGLTREAYDFWEILRKNTELTGSLFDPQPSRLPTNIVCTNDASRIAVGFITVSTQTSKRIFIRNSEVSLWPTTFPGVCSEVTLSRAAAEEFLRNNPSFLPAFIVTGGGLGLSTRDCVDCRTRGGTTQKPSFW